MSLALHHASHLKTEIRLAQAVSEFEGGLDTRQKAAFKNTQSMARMTPPTLKDVMQVTAEIDRQSHEKHKASRSFGPRLTNMLQSVQQYAALGDVVIGGSQNLVACGVWAAVRMMLQLSLGHLSYLERLSELFMEAGRQAPRHHAMALIYPKSKALQKYLCEYYIVVVKICQQIQVFSRKPMLSRMVSGLDDSELRRLQSDLSTWSTSISGQVEVLLNEHVLKESKQASKTRELLNKWSASEAYQRRLETKSRWLDVCSRYDYQTSWKQTRKQGTSSLFLSSQEYQSWKNDTASSALLLSGKVGAGKSVTMANIVDDLNLDPGSVVIYFFCRHDLPESLKCRTILGSLARQCLSQLSLDSETFTDDVPILDTFTMTKLMVSSIHTSRNYVLIDGLDECPAEERHSLLRCVAKLQHAPNWHLGFSARLSTEDLFGNDIKLTWHIHMPNINPDIEAYVDVELSRRENNGELVCGDNQLVSDIREALLQGANGMFLWVSLQLDAICQEASDYDIRLAIRSLPKDLAETYSRILKVSARLDHSSHHVRIFKFITATLEPLSLGQIQDIMSVVNHDTSWDPSKRINDVKRLLKFCGSLIMIDEEEQTVRFVHHTARNFCLGSLRGDPIESLLFTEIEAEQELGEVIVTYLNYGIFGKQLSTKVFPRLDAQRIPEAVAHETIGFSRQIASLFKPRSNPREVSHILADIDSARHGKHTPPDQHLFYPYAQRFWLLQSRHLVKPASRALWKHLAKDSSLLDVQNPTFTPHLVGVLEYFQPHKYSRNVLIVSWALNYSHLFLFEHIMNSKKDHRVSIQEAIARFEMFWRFFKALPRHPATPTSSNMTAQMICRLLPIAIQLRANKAVSWIVQWIKAHRNQVNKTDVSISHAMRSISLVRDLRIILLLARENISSTDDNTRALATITRSQIPQESLLLSCFTLIRAGISLESASFEETYSICHHLANSSELNEDKASEALNDILLKARAKLNLITRIFRQACSRGDLKLAVASWPSALDNTAGHLTSFQVDELLLLVLQTVSRDRFEIADRLLDEYRFYRSSVSGGLLVIKAIILRRWALARRLAERGVCTEEVVRFCADNELIHYCVWESDLEGLDVLLSVGMDINRESTGPSFPGSIPLELLAGVDSSWCRYYSLGELFQRGARFRRACGSDSVDMGHDEPKLLELLGSNSTLRSIWTFVDQSTQPESPTGESWIGHLVCVLTSLMWRKVTTCFSANLATRLPIRRREYQNAVYSAECVKDLQESVEILRDTFLRASFSGFSYAEILLPLHEIISAMEVLHSHRVAGPPDSPHSVARFVAQTVLLEAVDIILRYMVSSRDSILDDFCSILSNGPMAGIMSNSFSSSNDFFRQTLLPTIEENNLRWVLPCMLLLGEGFSAASLEDVVVTLRDSEYLTLGGETDKPHFLLEGSRRALQVMGCSTREAQFLYRQFGRYL